MNVGDFLELERPFHGNRILIPTPEEQTVVLIGKVFCQRLDCTVHVERLLKLCRKTHQRRTNGPCLLIAHSLVTTNGTGQH